MPHRHIIAHHGRVDFGSVNRAVILNVCPFSDDNFIVIPTQYRIKRMVLSSPMETSPITTDSFTILVDAAILPVVFVMTDFLVSFLIFILFLV